MDGGEPYAHTEATDMDMSRMYRADSDEGKLNEINSRVNSSGHFTCNTTEEADKIANDLSSRGVGNYQTVIRGGFAQVERIPDVFEPREMHGQVIHEVDYGFPAGERYSAEMEIRDAVMAQRSDLYSGIQHTPDYRPDEIDVDGSIRDFRRVDSFITSNRYRDGVLMDDGYEAHNAALTQRVDPGTLWPNFEEHCTLNPMEDIDALKESYTRYTDGHAWIKDIESRTGFGIDDHQHVSDQRELVDNAHLFNQEEIRRAIEAARDIHGSTDEPGSLFFMDPDRRGPNETSKVYRKILQDSWGAYDEDADDGRGAIIVNNKAPTEWFTDGGLYHEMFHKRIREDYTNEFDSLHETYGFRDDPTLDSMMKGFEEVASHVKTLEFVGDKHRYADLVSEEYGLGDFSREDLERFMGRTDVELKRRASEVIAFFEVADRDRAETFRQFLQEKHPKVFEEVDTLSDRYVRAVSSQEGLDFRWVEDILDTARNRFRKDVERDKGRFDP